MNRSPATEAFEEETHETPWMLRSAFQLLVIGLVATQGAIAAAVYHGWYWLAVPLVLFASHLMHGALIGLHEAAHGMLRKNRAFNEFDGILIGTLSLMSFSLYRAIHQTHHAHLTTERDCEFWPFVKPTTPLWARRLAAAIELNFGLFFTPFVFLRAFLKQPSPMRSKRVRRRVWAELALTVAVWAGVLSAVAVFGVWKYFLWAYFVPAFIAGNLQSWRKYIEHVGMTGASIRGCTRSIVTDTWAGRLWALTLLHEPLHGIHHLRAGVPHSELPQHVDELQPTRPDERTPFPSYRHALLDLVRCLADPRVGSQWRSVDSKFEKAA